MEIKKAEFVSSHTSLAKLPKTHLPEFAFIGRSNVGKSSLINMLCNKKSLAKTSSTPGKTQTINHFIINNEWYLVDLPGYGYARAPGNLRKLWSGFTFDYLIKRPNLICVMLLIDLRHKPQNTDMQFMEWLGINKIPFAIVFTKADKLTNALLKENVRKYLEELKNTWEELPTYFVTSSVKRTGRQELLSFFEKYSQRAIK
jgi:GTP-binding protein